MTINIVSLGCSKNIVDSEKLLKQLEINKFEIHHNSDQLTDVVIINTCGFILDAKTESIETILSYCRAKQSGLIQKLFVMGCLSERYKDSLKQEIPEVDEFFGVNDISTILKSLGGKYHAGFIHSRFLTTPSHYAYLKISEGCNRSCSFCAIPLIRGRQRSISVENLILEATELANSGVKEIMLIAQDLTSYGTDLYKSKMLIPLVEKLSAVQGIEWIRLHYAYPDELQMEELCDLMINNKKICHYIDIPFQHINQNILQRMRRGHGTEEVLDIINFMRKKVPDICIRSSFITGFPGETEVEFKELYEFVKSVRFDRLGVFTYSHEKDTPADFELKDDVPEKIKVRRMEEIMKLQESISHEKNYAKIGETCKVIIDGEEGEFYRGRTEFDSPEIDQEVLIPKSHKKLEIGNFYQIKFTNALEFDLFGEPVMI